jgi:hypothetical protein
MGYEITFIYHEKNEDGKPDMENSSTFTKSVGKRNEEVPLEKVGAIILGQMARRDVYISNVHIFEYVKREVSFKETKAGIIIKNKKFNFDQLSGELKMDDEVPQPPPQLPQLPQRKIVLDLPQEEDLNDFIPDLSQFKPSLPSPTVPEHPGLIPKMPQFNPNIIAQAQAKLQQQQQPVNTGPLRHEVFRPSREDFPMLQRNGFRLTMGKPYPVFKEFIKHPAEPVYYSIIDDSGSRAELSSIYFEPIRRGLIGMESGEPQLAQPEGRLAYVDYGPSGGEGGVGGMPVLRRN